MASELRAHGRTWAPVAAAAASVLFGSGLVVTRLSVRTVDPLFLAFFRVLIACACLLPLTLRRALPRRNDLLVILLLGALMSGLFPWAMTQALTSRPAWEAAMAVALSPALTLLLGVLLGGERASTNKILGVALATAGVFAVEVGPSGLASWKADLQGTVYLVLATSIAALYNVFASVQARRHGALAVTSLGTAGGIALLAPVVLGQLATRPLPPASLATLGWLLFLGLGPSALAVYLWSWALGRLTPTNVAVFWMLNPLSAALLGAVVLGEPLSTSIVIGFSLALVGAGLVTGGRAAREPQAGGQRQVTLAIGKVYLVHALGMRVLRAVEWFDARVSGRIRAREEDARPVLAPGAMAAGRYRLEAVLGEGGMGRVWMATDTLERRSVALKELRVSGPKGANDGGQSEVDLAFKREFYTMTKLQHPNTVKVFDFGMLATGDRYLTMEIVKGSDLAKLLTRGPLELPQVYKILIQLSEVLGFIHSRFFVHCDIKSENIRLTDRGEIRLMDFGLMHQLGTPTHGTLKGTLQYLAPEIPRGAPIDARTDLYAVGVLAFELATGRYPFSGKSVSDYIQAHLHAPPPAMAIYREVPAAFEAIVRKLLAKEPRERFASCAELLIALNKLAGRKGGEQNYAARTSYLQAAELVGRSAEQARLAQALTDVQAGQGKSLFVTAPPGVGKTRLLQEFKLSVKVADIPFLVGQCRAEGQAPRGAIVEALTQLLPLTPPEVLEQHGPVLARMLPALVGMGVAPAPARDPGADRIALLEAVRGWLGALAAHRPFILSFEDLHWADPATVELLNVITRELAGKPGMVLGTFRSNQVDRLSALFLTVDEGLTERLEIPPLGAADTDTLVRTMLGGLEISPEFVGRLFDTTGGNPFFVSETMRALIEEGLLVLEDGAWRTTRPPAEISLPADIHGVVTQRLAALDEPARQVLRRLAPMGRVLLLPVVRRVADVEDERFFALLDVFVERQFVQVAEQEYYFAHDTVREAIYLSSSTEEKQAAHQRIGEALEALNAQRLGAVASELGYHYARGTDRDKAVRFLSLAAEQARKSNLLFKTTELLVEASGLVEASETPAKRATLLSLWAQIIEIAWVSSPPLCVRFAEKLFERLRAQADLSQAARAFNEASSRLTRRGFWGRRRLKRMWSDFPLRPDDPSPLHLAPKVFQYRAHHAFALSSIGNEAKLLEVVEQQLEDSPEPGPVRASAFLGKAILLLHMGRFQELGEGARAAQASFERHLATVGVLPRWLWTFYSSSLHFVTVTQAMAGEPIDMQVWAKGVELAERLGIPESRWFLQASRAVRAAVSCDPDGMQASYDELVEGLRRMGHPQMQESRLPIWVASYWQQRLDVELSEAVCARMAFWSRKLPNDDWMRRYSLSHRAFHDVEHGPTARAHAALDEAFAALKGVPSFRLGAQLHCARARLALKMKKPLEARASAEEGLRLATDPATRTRWDELIARRVFAQTLVGQAAIEQAQQALSLARAWEQPFHEGLAHLTLATVCLEDRRALAAESLAAAERIFEQHRCPALLARVLQFRERAAGPGRSVEKGRAISDAGEA